MQPNIAKNIEKILNEFSKLDSFTKKIIMLGIRIFLALFSIGTILVVINRIFLNYETHLEFTATSIITASFTILAEIVIGGLLIDHVFKKS